MQKLQINQRIINQTKLINESSIKPKKVGQNTKRVGTIQLKDLT